MPKVGMTLDTLALAYAECEATATPHREPDFAYLKQNAIGGGNAEVTGNMIFIEEHNTGYEGNLYRWQFSVPGKDGKPIGFMADMLPDQITSGHTATGKTMYAHDNTPRQLELSPVQVRLIIGGLKSLKLSKTDTTTSKRVQDTIAYLEGFQV